MEEILRIAGKSFHTYRPTVLNQEQNRLRLCEMMENWNANVLCQVWTLLVEEELGFKLSFHLK